MNFLPLDNRVIRFVQLPSDTVQMAPMFVYGENLPRKINMAVYPPGDYISNNIRSSGNWEPQLIQPLMEYLRRHTEMHFLDIGSNIGVFTLNVASIRNGKRKILAVDANEKNCQMLAKSLAMNEWRDQVIIINNALDIDKRESRLIIDTNNVGGAYINGTNGSGRNYVNPHIMSIHSIFFDDLLQFIDFKTAAMKLDIEFSENRALKNAKRFFEKLLIPAIYLEWYAPPLRRTKEQYEELLEFFYSRNYEPFSSLRSDRILLRRPNYNDWPHDIVWLLKSYNHTAST
jgi:FkbM family methyltransferase